MKANSTMKIAASAVSAIALGAVLFYSQKMTINIEQDNLTTDTNTVVAEPVAENVSDELVYINDEYGISASYLPGYEIHEDFMGTIVVFLSEKDDESDGFQENVNILMQDISEWDMSLDEYTALNLEQLEQFITGYRLLSTNQATLVGMPAQQITYFGTQGTYDLQFTQVWTIINNKAYVVTYTAQLEKFEQYKDIFELVIHTLKVQDL